MGSPPVTLIFTDLVTSADLTQRHADEHAQRLLHAHYRLLVRCVAAPDRVELLTLLAK